MSHDFTLANLVSDFRRGQKLKFLLFWGHTPSHPGQLDQSCLSQWYPAAFEVDGDRFATAEHFMMAAKARLFEDEEVRTKILRASSPGAAKRLGREVRAFDDDIWKAARFDIVVEANRQKFSQNPDMHLFLKNTGQKVLVEAAPRDRIWGIGLGRNHEHAKNPLMWRGLNLLGFALMAARESI